MPELARHPDTPSHAVETVVADATRTQEGKLALTYSIRGDIAAVRVPPPGPARIGWKLWRHTCGEVFLRSQASEAYHEFNFSPSGEWTAYSFRRYREGGPLADEALNPQVAVLSGARQLDLYALLDLARLFPAHNRSPLVVGLAVIIEEESGGISYWALRHARGKPDFHHADAFALAVD